MATPTPPSIDPKLLDILRCPVAVHYTDHGDDPGRLELVRDYWLYCADSGYKYPIIDGIPKMLVEEGARWHDTDVADLPVPPPNEPLEAAVAEQAVPPQQAASGTPAATTPAPAAVANKQGGIPWVPVATVFVVGLVLSLLLRRGRKADRD